MREKGQPGALPVGVRAVLRLREARALYLSQLASLAGDQLARIALSVLVLRETGSPLATGAVYALTFLPVVVLGPLLGGLADRWPRRRVLVQADLARAALIGLAAVPRVPLVGLFVLVAAVNVLEAPFDAARAALLPDVAGELFRPAMALERALQQSAQVVGFGLGGVVLLVLSPRAALAVDAVTFLLSAWLLARGLLSRPAALAGDGRASWRQAGRDVLVGTRVVAGDRMLRRLVLLTWAVAAVGVVPEGLAAPWGRSLGASAGWVGLLLAANPAGNVLGSLLLARLPEAFADRALMPLALLAVLPLLVAVIGPAPWLAVALVGLSGLGMTTSLVARGLFTEQVPAHVRGRALMVAGTGISVAQGVAVAAAGALAETMAVPRVVALAALLGLTALAGLVLLGPARAEGRPAGRRSAVATEKTTSLPI